MRVIAGSAKSLRLKTLPGLSTRPTQDKIKETLFNMLYQDVVSCRFLDLFSGSGAIGIEALSRGAASCTFIEQNHDAVAIIKENLAFTHLSSCATIIKKDVLSALKALKTKSNTAPFDIIFLDPPYHLGIEKAILLELFDSSLITQESMIIIESDKHTSFNYIKEINYTLIKEKHYKNNKHIFLRPGGNL